MANNVKISAVNILPVNARGREYSPAQLADEVIANLAARMGSVAGEHPDLIILSECANRPAGLTVDERFHFYHTYGRMIEEFVSSYAKAHRTNIAFGEARVEKHPEDEAYPYRNSVVYFDREGEVAGIYDKCFLVPSEHTVTKIGYGKLPEELISLDFGKVGTAICFDLHDVTLLERYVALNPNLIVFSSNFAGKVWADTWAAQCGAYFAAALGNALHEMVRIINPFGTVVAASDPETRSATATVNLDFRIIHNDDNNTKSTPKFDLAKEKYGDGFSWINTNGGGVSMAQSNLLDKTIDDIIDEFSILCADDYFGTTYRQREAYYKKIGYTPDLTLHPVLGRRK